MALRRYGLAPFWAVPLSNIGPCCGHSKIYTFGIPPFLTIFNILVKGEKERKLEADTRKTDKVEKFI